MGTLRWAFRGWVLLFGVAGVVVTWLAQGGQEGPFLVLSFLAFPLGLLYPVIILVFYYGIVGIFGFEGAPVASPVIFGILFALAALIQVWVARFVVGQLQRRRRGREMSDAFHQERAERINGITQPPE